MEKVTYDMLDEFGSVIKSIFKMLYPNGLTREELKVKSEEFTWLRKINEKFQGDV